MRPKFNLRKKRSVNLIIAITMLALPASAVALASAATVPGQTTDTQTANQGTSLQLRVTPQRIKYNHPVTVSGRAPAPAAGQTIALQTAPLHTLNWRTLRTAKIGRDGRFRMRAALRQSSYVRAVENPSGPVAIAATTGRYGVAANAVAVSVPRPVAVAAQFRIQRHSHEVLGSSPIQVGGRLLPASAGRTVRLQGHYPNGWHTLASSRTGHAGGFRLRSKASNGLERRLRVAFTGDAANARTTRSAGQVTVYDNESVASWYDDSGNTACGFHAGLGVANRDLPCGTKVRFRYGGRSVTAVVDDRGPFVGGRDWDLNQNTAAALNFGGVGTVWTTQ